MSPTRTDPVHFVSIERNHHLTSPTLRAEAAQRLESAFRSARWYRDKWSQRLFQDSVEQVRRDDAPGGLVIIGPGVRVAPPPPFEEFFEPIELGQADPQLRTLTSETPTRQEILQKWAASILGVALLLGVAYLFVDYLLGRTGSIPLRVLAIPAGVAVLAVAAGYTVFSRERWFLLPGGVAIVRSRKRDPLERLLVVVRGETPALVRYVRHGNSTVLVIEVWSTDGRRWQRIATEREAIAFLAAWQSPLPTPSREELRELPI